MKAATLRPNKKPFSLQVWARRQPWLLHGSALALVKDLFVEDTTIVMFGRFTIP